MRQLEDLDRGLIAMMTEKGVFISWRLLAPEFETTAFELYRDGCLIASLTKAENSNYLDEEGTLDSVYAVKAVSGEKVTLSNEVKVLKHQYFDIPLEIPEDGVTPTGERYTYSANDLSVGDVDGDGRYEIFVKWYPSNAKDNAHSGYTGNTLIDCYTLEGHHLWRIDLGINIRSGAHYTQFVVYDFDGDGIAELVCKTADGTVDGTGRSIGETEKDHRNQAGFILEGQEYLTLFDGTTGKALDTIEYEPARGDSSRWGDSEGNRVDRFLASVAYLNGETASAIMCRGYYTRTVLVAYDIINKRLVKRWSVDSDEGLPDLAGQGAHSLSVADIDEDGYDEIIYGSAVIDHDGSLRYATGFGHGDALHVGKFNLDREGLQVFMTHEETPNEYGIEMRDAKTGEVLFHLPSITEDIGRGVVADIDPRYKGAEVWFYAPDQHRRVPGTEGFCTATGKPISGPVPPANFVIWWDGDLGREILDHDYDEAQKAGPGVISKWNWETKTLDVLLKAEGTLSNNGTKGNPNLQADLLGDWREEVIWRLADSSALRVYSTTDYCPHRIYTLMHDSQYRVAIAWQNVAYNQPPHPSFYIGFDEEAVKIPIPKIQLVKKGPEKKPVFLHKRACSLS